MTHRAEQVVDAIVTLLQASTSLGVAPENVFAHRSLSLSENQGEMPAITVNIGDDAVVDEFGNDNDGDGELIDSMLAISVVIYMSGYNEPEVKRSLMAAREASHVALLTDCKLGLEFVVVTRYGGAGAPTLDSSTEVVIGQLPAAFNVHYRMNAANPA